MRVVIVPTLVKIHNQDSNHNIKIEGGCERDAYCWNSKDDFDRINTNYIITLTTNPFGE